MSPDAALIPPRPARSTGTSGDSPGQLITRQPLAIGARPRTSVGPFHAGWRKTLKPLPGIRRPRQQRSTMGVDGRERGSPASPKKTPVFNPRSQFPGGLAPDVPPAPIGLPDPLHDVLRPDLLHAVAEVLAQASIEDLPDFRIPGKLPADRDADGSSSRHRPCRRRPLGRGGRGPSDRHSHAAIDSAFSLSSRTDFGTSPTT